jgi:hypothetical protein
MAKRNSTSNGNANRRDSARRADRSRKGPKAVRIASIFNHVENIVEDERARLMKAHSILECVVMAMEEEQICHTEGPYWPSVIESALGMIDESIRRLDSLDYSPQANVSS